MVILVSSIVFAVSFIVLSAIVFRKIPALVQLPETAPFQIDLQGFFSKIKTLKLFKDFSFEILLQRILSKVRILTLRTDNKTSNWLQKLREKSQKKKFSEDDDYWKKVRKSTKL